MTKEEKAEITELMLTLSADLELLIDDLEKLEKYPTIFKGHLKTRAIALKKEIDSRLNIIFDCNEVAQKQFFFIIEMVRKAKEKIRKKITMANLKSVV